jgi:hypothetical protein
MKPIRQLPTFIPASILFVLFSIILITSCKKEKQSSVVEISEVKTGGNVKTIPLIFGAGNETINIITLKNTGPAAAHVKLAKDDAALGTAKTKLLPSANYTLGTLEFDVPANSTVSVPITIINNNTIPLDTLYGIGLKIDSITGATIDNTAKSIVVRFDLRNKFDGRYRVTGTMVDIAAPTITGYFPQDVDLITSGANSMTMIPRDLGIPGFLILSGTSLSYYGSFGPIFTLNLTNNKIVSVTNYYGQPASNTRSAEIDPSGTNQYDPATKTITIKFFMKQPNTVTTAPNIRVYYNNTFTYLGPRFQQ